MNWILFRSAIILSVIGAVSACAHGPARVEQNNYGAYGYLSPGPTGEPEFIGSYPTLKECEAAANEWTTRQVVGNPIHAECYPVDKH